jgi:hypothetical protein
MAGSREGACKGAYNRLRGRKTKHSRVAVNLDGDVYETIVKLAKRKKTTLADYVRNMIETRVARVKSEAFENNNKITGKVVH